MLLGCLKFCFGYFFGFRIAIGCLSFFKVKVFSILEVSRIGFGKLCTMSYLGKDRNGSCLCSRRVL